MSQEQPERHINPANPPQDTNDRDLMIFLGRMDAKIDNIMAEQKAQAKKQDDLETRVQALDQRVGKLETSEGDRETLPDRVNEIENFQQRERGRRNILVGVAGFVGTLVGTFSKFIVSKGDAIIGG